MADTSRPASGKAFWPALLAGAFGVTFAQPAFAQGDPLSDLAAALTGGDVPTLDSLAPNGAFDINKGKMVTQSEAVETLRGCTVRETHSDNYSGRIIFDCARYAVDPCFAGYKALYSFGLQSLSLVAQRRFSDDCVQAVAPPAPPPSPRPQ